MFDVERGLRQGCVPDLFSLVFDMICKALVLARGAGTLHHRNGKLEQHGASPTKKTRNKRRREGSHKQAIPRGEGAGGEARGPYVMRNKCCTPTLWALHRYHREDWRGGRLL